MPIVPGSSSRLLDLVKRDKTVGVIDVSEHETAVHKDSCRALAQHKLVVPGGVWMIIHQWADLNSQRLKASLVLLELFHAKDHKHYSLTACRQPIAQWLIELRRLGGRRQDFQAGLPADAHDEPHVLSFETRQLHTCQTFQLGDV